MMWLQQTSCGIAGAAIGSFGGPIGAIICSIIGAIAGGLCASGLASFGTEKLWNYLKNKYPWLLDSKEVCLPNYVFFFYYINII